MSKPKFITFLIISIISVLAACAKTPEVSKTLAQEKDSNGGTSIVNRRDYVSQGDIYETTYTIRTAGSNEDSIKKVITWGRPSEIGIIYFQQDYPNSNLLTFQGPSAGSKKAFSARVNTMYAQQIVVKSKGVLPQLKKPLTLGNFTPIEPFPVPFRDFFRDNKRIFESGRVQIISVKKLPVEQEESMVNYQPPTKVSQNSFNSLPSSQEFLNAFYIISAKKPDLKPQQVDKITWQEGQPPQIIPVRQW